jgi:DNA mismatch repair protein MutL
MNQHDAKICCERHATSKISDFQDLFNIKTLGFRGEALSSIAAVSILTLSTRKEEDIAGSRIAIEGGKFLGASEIGCPKGTTVEVKDLFYNTPARKKFLQNKENETEAIIEVAERYALAYPEVAFRLTEGSHTLLNAPATVDKLSRIANIFGQEFAKQLISFEEERKGMRISGFISKPSLTRASKDYQIFYFNRRLIKKNTAISEALQDAYKTLVMVGRNPVAIISIDIDASDIDVNVHPQKAEIRLNDEQLIYEFAHDSISKALSSISLVPEVRLANDMQLTMFENQSKGYRTEDSEQQLLVKENASVKPNLLPEMRILGIINKTYIVAEMQGSLIFIDQHAAAERILYEEFMEDLRNRKVKVQKLIVPEIQSLSPKQHLAAIKNSEHLASLGYSIEDYGKDTVRINSIPVVLGRQFNKDLFIDFVEEMSGRKIASLEDFFHKKIARMACRTAIKAGDDLTLPQIKDYVVRLLSKNIPYTCPHGRPILLRWSTYDLEKMFKRIP